MPAFTPRGYPYSVPTDPADVPQAIQDLAEAIDPDAEAQADSIGPREVFRLSSTTVVSFASWVTFTISPPMPFDVMDANVGDALPTINGPTTRITPRLPGFWWFQGSITYPRASGATRDLFGVTLRQNGSFTMGRNATHLRPPASDGGNNVACSAGAFFNGTTDYLELLGHSRAISSVFGSPMNVRNRYLLGMRMTTS